MTEKAKKYDTNDATKWLARVSAHRISNEEMKYHNKITFQSAYFFYFSQALQYNVPCGKKNRGLATVLTYKSLIANESELTPENVRLAHYLGWCVEMVSKHKITFHSVTDTKQIIFRMQNNRMLHNNV